MTTPIKILIMLVLWAVYTLLAWVGCLSGCCSAVQSDTAITTTDQATASLEDGTALVKRFPIDFQWSSSKPNTNEGFEEQKEQILAQMNPKNILDITGFYYEPENKPDDYANLGFARAEAVKNLLGLDLPEDRIRFHARLLDMDSLALTNNFEGFDYKWIDPDKRLAETVEELSDRTNIRFPFGSIEKDYSPEVDEYLKKLAERVKTTKEQISLTGHTDYVGEEDANRKLGQARAEQIKKLLISLGVDAALISTESKGESQPSASNETEEGRHENRRVVVRYFKN